MNYLDKTCDSCKHWVKKGVDPNDLGAGVKGSCRESLHVLSVPAGPHGQVGLAVTYIEVPGTMPACSHYEGKVCLVDSAS